MTFQRSDQPIDPTTGPGIRTRSGPSRSPDDPQIASWRRAVRHAVRPLAAVVVSVLAVALTVGAMATAADGDVGHAQDHTYTTVEPNGHLSDRSGDPAAVSKQSGMLKVPDQRVAGLIDHVDPSCTGNGQDGDRVQVLYVRSKAEPSQFARRKPAILDEVRTVDDVFAASAAKTGGGLRVRWVYGPGCVPAIDEVAVSPAAIADKFAVMKSELRAQGYDRSDRKYLVFSESTENCGTSDGNVPGSISRIDSVCWPLAGTAIAAHELGHGLGAVSPQAPHFSGLGHCTETGDLMCNGQQAPGDPVIHACPSWQGNWFDCGNDDYFSTDPAPGSFLDSSLNIARSPFLDTVAPLPPAPDVQVTAQAAPRAARIRAQQGQVVTVRATSPHPVAGWKFPAVSGLCRLSTTDRPQLRPQAGTATYNCLQHEGTAASFTVQALGSNNRVGYGADHVVLHTAPVYMEFSGRPTAGRAFTATAVGDGGDPHLSYWWKGGSGCHLNQGHNPGPKATISCPPRMSGRSIAVTVSVYHRNGNQINVTRRVALHRG